MMEDFFVGSGARVRPSDKEMAEMRADYERAWQVVIDAPLPAAARLALDKLAGADDLLKEADLDGVRSLLASPELLSMGIRITPKPKSQVMGAWATCSKQPACQDSLDDARTAINELEEWCFTNRVEYYNTADRAQVMKQGEGMSNALQRIKSNLEEPRDHLQQAREALGQLSQAGKA